MMLLTLLLIIIFVLLVVSSHFFPMPATTSRFELTRRASEGDSAARAALVHEKQQDDIASLQLIVTAILLMAFMAVSIVRFGWGVGITLAFVVALTYGAIGRIGFVYRFSRNIYPRHVQRSRQLVEKFPRITQLLRHAPRGVRHDMRLGSRQELEHMITTSHGVLDVDEKALILHGLAFNERTVQEIMTPTDKIDTIGKKEMLGPLVLDDLHKTGHSHFPVIDKDINHVIGILRAQDMLTLDIKRSVTAEKAMDGHVYYICYDQPLQKALAAFLKTHHHLLIVINEDRETVGLLSMEDTLEALIGCKIKDDFDAHNDKHAVAKRSFVRTKTTE